MASATSFYDFKPADSKLSSHPIHHIPAPLHPCNAVIVQAHLCLTWVTGYGYDDGNGDGDGDGGAHAV